MYWNAYRLNRLRTWRNCDGGFTIIGRVSLSPLANDFIIIIIIVNTIIKGYDPAWSRMPAGTCSVERPHQIHISTVEQVMDHFSNSKRRLLDFVA